MTPPCSSRTTRNMPPGRSVPSRRWVDARGAQDFIDSGRPDRHAQLGQLAVNTVVTPQWVLLRQADGQPGDAPDRRRAAGPVPLTGVVFPGDEPAVPGEQRRRRHREDLHPAPARDEPGKAANQARSAGLYRIRPAFRRSTAFSCRSTSNSASFALFPRNPSTPRPNYQRISMQTILSSTRSANHHSTSLAAKRAGQQHDRVPGRHRVTTFWSDWGTSSRRIDQPFIVASE
jgi:hypothetical protein